LIKPNTLLVVTLASSFACSAFALDPTPEPTRPQLRGAVSAAGGANDAQLAAARSMDQTTLGTSVNQQQTAQQNTATANDQGAAQAGKLGGSQTMLGGALMALGAVIQPPPAKIPVIAAGLFQLMQGKKSYSAQKALNGVGQEAWTHSGDLNSGITNVTGTSVPSGTVGFDNAGTNSGTIDFSNPSSTSLSSFISGLEGSGISQAEMQKYLNHDMAAIKKQYPNVSDSQWDSALKDAETAFADPNSAEAKALLEAAGKNGALLGAVYADGTVGSGASYENAAANAAGTSNQTGNSLADLLKNLGANKNDASNSAANGTGIIDDALTKATDGKDKKDGRQLASYSEKTLFQRVTAQYSKQGSGMISTDSYIRSKVKEQPSALRDYIK
jgi:hypothetical protein